MNSGFFVYFFRVSASQDRCIARDFTDRFFWNSYIYISSCDEELRDGETNVFFLSHPSFLESPILLHKEKGSSSRKRLYGE